MSAYDDWCVDCVFYGDDYYTNEDGERVCRCPKCGFSRDDDDEEE